MQKKTHTHTNKHFEILKGTQANYCTGNVSWCYMQDSYNKSITWGVNFENETFDQFLFARFGFVLFLFPGLVSANHKRKHASLPKTLNALSKNKQTIHECCKVCMFFLFCVLSFGLDWDARQQHNGAIKKLCGLLV